MSHVLVADHVDLRYTRVILHYSVCKSKDKIDHMVANLNQRGN